MKWVKKIFKSIDVAFSIYSKIPMPRFEWESEDMKYHLCFFPWVGALIGICVVAWNKFGILFQIPEQARIAIWAAIPLLITGGFHVDGFMDTMDAIHSYQEKERKLEILKDPHIGAFSVISLLAYVLVGIAGLSLIDQESAVLQVGISFFVVRGLSGIAVLLFPNAKEKGMVATFTKTAEKRVVVGTLIFQVLLGAVGMLVCCWYLGCISLLVLGCFYFYYYKMSYKQFGGITGDLAGFFVTVSELLVVLSMGISCLFF